MEKDSFRNYTSLSDLMWWFDELIVHCGRAHHLASPYVKDAKELKNKLNELIEPLPLSMVKTKFNQLVVELDIILRQRRYNRRNNRRQIRRWSLNNGN